MTIDLMTHYHPMTKDLLEAFGLNGKEVQSVELKANMRDIFKIKASFFVNAPKKTFTDYFTFGLFPLDWEGHCIGCKYYGFGRHCDLTNGYIPYSDDAYSFFCKCWSPSSRNMILYRRFTDD